MDKDTLFYFSSIAEFEKFYKNLNIYHGWQLQEGLLNNRGKNIRDKRYAKKFIDEFDSRNFFYKKVSIAEIISWLDNLELLRRLLTSLTIELKADNYTKIEIHFEYMIQLSKNMRVDLVLKNGSKILLIEFRMVDDFNKIKRTWDKKMAELLIYKELLSYYSDKKNEIYIYAFISLHEYFKNQPIMKHIEHNEKQINYLTSYVSRYMFD